MISRYRLKVPPWRVHNMPFDGLQGVCNFHFRQDFGKIYGKNITPASVFAVANIGKLSEKPHSLG